MLRKIFHEIVAIRKELQEIKKDKEITFSQRFPDGDCNELAQKTVQDIKAIRGCFF